MTCKKQKARKHGVCSGENELPSLIVNENLTDTK